VEQNIYKKAQPCNWSEKEIYDFAEEVAKELGYKYGEPLEPIVERLGGKIIYQDINEWYGTNSGSIVIDGKDNFTIYVSNFTSPLRDRFTIAHELGHYILHSGIGKIPMRVPRSGKNQVEFEANCFAAAFLMPANIFSEKLKKTNDASILAAEFCVSRSAIEARKVSCLTK